MVQSYAHERKWVRCVIREQEVRCLSFFLYLRWLVFQCRAFVLRTFLHHIKRVQPKQRTAFHLLGAETMFYAFSAQNILQSFCEVGALA